MITETQSNNLIKKIKTFDTIIIAKHISPDWDAQGSALGLKHIIQDNFPDKSVYVVGAKLNEAANFEDEFTIDETNLNNSLLITVDVANFDRIDYQHKNDVKEIFKIDHHLESDNFTEDKLVDDKAISCTQVISQWAYFNKLKVSKTAAEFLYFGLITDSGRFLYRNTSAETFEVASNLLQENIDITKIYDDLYLKNLVVVKWLNKMFLKAKQVKDYPISYIVIKDKDLRKSIIREEKMKLALSTMSGIKEIDIWFLVYKNKLGELKVSLRSRNFDINSVAIKYNGGGHKLASGCKLTSLKELKLLIEDLKKLINNNI